MTVTKRRLPFRVLSVCGGQVRVPFHFPPSCGHAKSLIAASATLSAVLLAGSAAIRRFRRRQSHHRAGGYMLTACSAALLPGALSCVCNRRSSSCNATSNHRVGSPATIHRIYRLPFETQVAAFHPAGHRPSHSTSRPQDGCTHTAVAAGCAAASQRHHKRHSLEVSRLVC
jgi:hypothetical protein